MSANDKTFGQKVKDFRLKRGLKQGVLADRSGLSQSEISRIEKGHVKGLKKETIEKLAEALEVKPHVLVRGTTFASLFDQPLLMPLGGATEEFPTIAYFASALTGLNDEQYQEVKELDSKVDEICNTYNSYNVALYRPIMNTSPKDKPKLPARLVYDTDQERVATADLVILAAIYPSLGAGMELQIALQSCSSIIILKKQGQPLSKMVIGCPARMIILEYNDLDDLESKLVNAMDELLPILAEFRYTHPQPENESANFRLGERIRQLREQRRYQVEDLARMVGVDTPCIETLEKKSEEISNPSLQLLRRLARALLTTESYLVSGQQNVDSRFIEHSEALMAYAEEVNMSAREVNQLWSAHYSTHKHDLSLLGVDNRAEVGDRKYWAEQFGKLKRSEKKASKNGKKERKLF